MYEKKLQKLLDQPAVEPEAPADITTLPKADSNQNGNTNSDQYSDKEDGELSLHIYRDHLFCFIMLSTINNSNIDNIVFFRGYCSSWARARARPCGREARQEQRENPCDHQNQQQTTSQGETHYLCF